MAYLAREHGLALLIYALLSLLLSWPTLPGFTAALTGTSHEDPLHNLWILWHTQQVALGRESPFFSTLLYYPHGISLLTHGLGPFTGLFALPFWGWGPEAAHNATLLISLWLTGYSMYLLARGMGFERAVALFAGTMLIASPMALAGLFGHITKVFLAGLPLALLSTIHALNPARSRWWALGVGAALLIILLHNGYQFVFAALSIAFFMLAAWLAGARGQRRAIFGRAVLVGVCALAVAGPLLAAVVQASHDSALLVDITDESANYAPDLIRFFIPPFFSQALGWMTTAALPDDLSSPELAVALSWAGIGLCLVAVLRVRRARIWGVFTLLLVLLALGPQLLVFGHTFALPMPYAWLTALPGLGFIRAPGRFMMMGFVGFGITASFGLAWLIERWPAYRRPIALAAAALVLAVNWPAPFPQQKLPPVPRFYQQIAADGEQYGVFDLPVNPTPGQDSYVTKSALYQIYQITHHKGIAGGYISRTYAEHPLFPYLMADRFEPYQANLLLNGQPARYGIAQAELARYGYRYVVWHKAQTPAAAAGDAAAAEFVQNVFGSQPPLVDDELVRVYRITSSLTTTVVLGDNWRAADAEWRWARSPATLAITSPRAQAALLRITPAMLYDPAAANGLGRTGRLSIQAGDGARYEVDVAMDRVASVPLELAAGSQTISLALAAGNFQPRSYGSADPATLSFAIRSIELQTAGQFTAADIPVTQPAHSAPDQPIVAVYGPGWYDYDAGIGARWASGTASLAIYSPAARQVRLQITPKLLHDPAGPGALGQNGSFEVRTNGAAEQRLDIQTGRPVGIDLALRDGWNTISLALAAGSFRPADVQPGNRDQRDLGFAVAALDVVAR